ncbi:MAG: hypothetical protein methR_P2570 [Methyloprofundus sp.]|nr:MAG: hypothetical protein methR_P2570 [Methyloprofundus sp.]
MIHIQFIKYVVIGLASNGILYGAYLGLTAYGLGHKTAMTLLYVIGVLQTFVFNKKWTFSHQGAVSGTLIRYILSYALGYILNLLALYYFVDQLLFPHQIIQGGMIILNALILFILQKFWVFKESDNKTTKLHVGHSTTPLSKKSRSKKRKKKKKKKKKSRTKRRKK